MQITDAPLTGRIWAITGNIGNGKNTLAVELVRLLSNYCMHGIKQNEYCKFCVEQAKERILQVYANFYITLPNIDFHFLEDYRDLLRIKKDLQYKKLWIIDEPNAWAFDSRESLSERNKRIARKIQHARHYNADVIFITQLNSMLDLRGRRLIQQGIWAITPSKKYFQYGFFGDGDEIIPLLLSKKIAKRYIFPYFDSSTIIGEDEYNEN